VDGAAVEFDAYTINSQTYYQIADIARSIKNSDKRFSASWDGALGAINLTSGGTQDGELSPKGTTVKTANETKAKIYLDGREAQLKAYTIDGHTYYQMKAVAELFGFYAGWNGESGTIEIVTNKEATVAFKAPPELADAEYLGTWPFQLQGKHAQYLKGLNFTEGTAIFVITELSAFDNISDVPAAIVGYEPALSLDQLTRGTWTWFSVTNLDYILIM
jgi:hypothetical protein